MASYRAGFMARAAAGRSQQQPPSQQPPESPAEQAGPQFGAGTQSSSRLLLAPGGRFREETSEPGAPAVLRLSDGQSFWHAGRKLVPSSGRATPPCDELLCPAWLPASFRLELTGQTIIAGRQALRITATPRPIPPGPSPGFRRWRRGDNPIERGGALIAAGLWVPLPCRPHCR